MSVDIAQVVYCDVEDCRRYATFIVTTPSEARAAAEFEGWEYTPSENGRDICPGHNVTGGPF